MPDPTVRGHLVAKIGELVGPSVQDPGRDQGGARAASPGEGRSCRNAITMCSVMIDEIRLRAHAQPLDEAQGDIAN